MGVRADGTKELIALADGYRESAEAWAGLLRDCVRRGMRTLVLAVGDGALGFWKALAEVFPDTREQKCWVLKSRKESRCCFTDTGSLSGYGGSGGDLFPTSVQVFGVVASPERAAAASGTG